MAQSGSSGGETRSHDSDIEAGGSDYSAMMQKLEPCYGEKAKLANKNFCAGVTSTALGSSLGSCAGAILFNQLGFVLCTVGGGVVLGGLLAYKMFSWVNEETRPEDRAFARNSFFAGAALGWVPTTAVSATVGELGHVVVTGMIETFGVPGAGLLLNSCLEDKPSSSSSSSPSESPRNSVS